jgi:hypothetical protein
MSTDPADPNLRAAERYPDRTGFIHLDPGLGEQSFF